MNVSELLERAETCHREVALEYFNAFAGLQDTLDTTSILSKYPELYSRETYDHINGLDETKVPAERERRFLKMVFTFNFITDKLKELTDQLANAESAAVVEVDGEQVPYRAAPVALAQEPDYQKRGRLDRAFVAKLDELNPIRAEADGIARELVAELGYESTIAMMEELGRMRIYPLRDLLTPLLADTQFAYEERLARYAGEAGLQREQLRHGDIGYVMRAGRFDELFPPQDMVPALERTLRGLGIDLDSQDNVTLDLEERPKKSPRAFCIGIDVPRDVRLVLQPRGGQNDYATLLHEAGHLQFGAHMAPGLSFLYRQYGDTSVHESYAFLLQHLVSDPVWWREIMKADPGRFPAFSRFHRLYLVRRYSAKLHYEIEYFERGGGPALAGAYAKWLEHGCGIPYPPERYLADFDFGFYVLQYLQAWLWEQQLREHLRREFGEVWFSKRAAGDFLRELWRDGQKFDVWEIAEKLGYAGLDVAPLKAELLA